MKIEAHGAVSPYLNRTLHAGSALEVAALRGDFVLDDGSGPVLLISAGIGVTPVLSILHQLAQARSERKVWWIYSARRPREHPLAAETRALLQSLPHPRALFYSQATPAELHREHAVAGHVTKDTLAAGQRAGLRLRAANVHGRRARRPQRGGHQAASVHTELFGGPATRQPWRRRPCSPCAAPAARTARHRAAGNLRPQRNFRALRRQLAQPPRPGDACDVPSRWSCRTGVCHTSITTLLSCAVSYSPDPLEAPSEGRVLICCSPAPIRHHPGHVTGNGTPPRDTQPPQPATGSANPAGIRRLSDPRPGRRQ